MNEFGAELHGDRQPGHLERPDAAADAVARFEHDRRFPAAGQLRRGGQPGGAGAEDRYIV